MQHKKKKTASNSRSEKDRRLQDICRKYLSQLRAAAVKHGLEKWLDDIIKANKNEQCKATEKEVAALSRFLDDERVTRHEIPKILKKSYRECNDDEVFSKIKKLNRVGIYSKLSTMLLNMKKKID